MKLQGSRFAYISDLHGKDPKKYIRTLYKHPVDLIVLGGDIPDYTQKNFISLCKKFLRLNIPIIIFPGSHENCFMYKKALSKIKNKLLIDATKIKNRRIQFGDVDLIIIPGSDSVSSGSKPYNGGTYYLFDKKDAAQLRRAKKKLRDIQFAQTVSPMYLQDIRALMKHPRSTPSRRILLTHIPFRCKTKRGIDVAHFAIAQKDFTLSKKDSTMRSHKNLHVVKGNIFPLKQAKILKKRGYPLKLQKKNVGSLLISKFMKRYSITKFICGHIHEAGKRAISKTEKKIKPQIYYKNAFINSGEGLTIITCKKERISYEFK